MRSPALVASTLFCFFAATNATDAVFSDEEPVFLFGRCVSAETKDPLAHCAVHLHGWVRSQAALERFGSADWTDPEPAVSGADGTFLLGFHPPGADQFSVDVTGPGRVPRTARWTGFAPGARVDLGDIPLSIGQVVRGRVVDQNGEVVRVTLRVRQLPLPFLGDGSGDVLYTENFGEEGFAFRQPLPQGLWPLEVVQGGVHLLSPEFVRVEDAPVEDLVVRVHRDASFRGVVVDQSGEPVSGATVSLAAEGWDWRPTARTDSRGAFEFHSTEVPDARFRASTVVGRTRDGRYGRAQSEWGQFDGPPVRIEVVLEPLEH